VFHKWDSEAVSRMPGGPKRCGDFFGDSLISVWLCQAPFAASARKRLSKCWASYPFQAWGARGRVFESLRPDHYS